MSNRPGIPEKIGPFRVTRELGRGGMGVVYEAHDLLLQRLVAVKVLRPDASDREAIRRFVAEARIAAQLEHPSILPVYATGTARDGALWLAMRRIEGMTLRDLLLAEVRPADWSRARLLRGFIQICQATAFAHARDVVHGDITPSNLIFGAFGQVFVADWGLAASVGAAIVGQGTSGYAAPEQQLPGAKADPKGDVFALGAVLYELLTLSRAFPGKTAEDRLVRSKLPVGDPRRATPHGVSDTLAEACLRALAPLETRTRSADLLAGEVEAALELEPRR